MDDLPASHSSARDTLPVAPPPAPSTPALDTAVPRPDVRSLYGWPVKRKAGLARQVSSGRCPACTQPLAVERFEVGDVESPLVACRTCGTLRYEPALSLDQIVGFYPRQYYGSEGRKFEPVVEWVVRKLAARQARAVARTVPRGGRVLDIGCGRGTLLSALARGGYEPHGFELSPQAALGVDPRIALRFGAHVRDAEYAAESFDACVLWHVLEHLPDPRGTIAECARILKPGGTLIVAVPNFSSWQARWAGDAWFHLDAPRHLFHFPLAALQQLVTGCGLTCLEAHHFSLRQNPFGWLQSALNKFSALPRNSLYCLLHRHPLPTARSLTAWDRLFLRGVYFAGMPIALALSVIEALAGRGGTVHIVARKPAGPSR